jgi:hypothetical protein
MRKLECGSALAALAGGLLLIPGCSVDELFFSDSVNRLVNTFSANIEELCKCDTGDTADSAFVDLVCDSLAREGLEAAARRCLQEILDNDPNTEAGFNCVSDAFDENLTCAQNAMCDAMALDTCGTDLGTAIDLCPDVGADECEF